MSLTANQIILLNKSIGYGIWNSLAHGVTPSPTKLVFGPPPAQNNDAVYAAVKLLPDATVIPILTAFQTALLAQLNAQIATDNAEITALTAL